MGQIKNIKLHIVTDIKIRTMASLLLRHAVRALGKATRMNNASTAGLVVATRKRHDDYDLGLYEKEFPEDPHPPELPITTPGPEWVDEGWKDDGLGYHGVYPNCKPFRFEHREYRPAIPYFSDQDKRYFGEPVHIDDDILNIWQPDDGTQDPFLTTEKILKDFAVLSGLLLALVAFDYYVVDGPGRNAAVPLQYPFNNLYLERGGDPSILNPTVEDFEGLTDINEVMHSYE